MCIDSTSVIRCIRGNASPSSQWAFHGCQDALITMDIKIKWAPGHMGIEGNEEADRLADWAADPERPHPCPDPRSHYPTVSGIKSDARRITRDAAQNWWSRSSEGLSARYRRWGLRYEIKAPLELSLPRSTLHRILALRTGHGDFRWYHRKFKHVDAKLVCGCGMEKTEEHLVHCRRVFRFFYNWPLRPKRPPRDSKEGYDYIQKLLKKPQKFADFLQLTSFYDKVCTR